jgi:hypothetical protein
MPTFKISLLIIAICLSAALCELHVQHEMTVSALLGHAHLNDMLANTLARKPAYMLGLPDYHAYWNLNTFEGSQRNYEFAHKYITETVGEEFDRVRPELEAATQMEPSETWLTFVALPAAMGRNTYPKVVVMKWDTDTRRYQIMVLTTQTPLASSLQTNHLIRFSSQLGFEAGEATLIAEELSAYAEHAYALARVVMISAYERLGFLRGVDKDSKWNEEQFKLWKSPKHRLGVNPVVVVTVAAMAVQFAAKIYGMIAKIFSTQVKTELIGQFKSKGFSQFRLSANFRRNFDIREQHIEAFANLLTLVLTKNHPNVQKRERISAAIQLRSS